MSSRVTLPHHVFFLILAGAPRSAPVQSEGSYMLSYLREKEKQEHRAKPWYRVYGLKDYKRMQNEVRLGTRTLGPDLDNETYKERVGRDSVCGLLSALLCGLLVCLFCHQYVSVGHLIETTYILLLQCSVHLHSYFFA